MINRLIFVIIFCFSSLMVFGHDNDSSIQKRDTIKAKVIYTTNDSIIDRLSSVSYKTDTVKAQILYLDDLEDNTGDVIIYGNEVKFLFTIEQVQKINNNYRLLELMEDVIEKYGIEKDFSIDIVSSLNSEISILNEKIEIKDGQLADRGTMIQSLNKTIKDYEMKDKITEQLLNNNEKQISNLKKENKKLKTFNKIVSGAGVVLAIIVIAIAI